MDATGASNDEADDEESEEGGVVGTITLDNIRDGVVSARTHKCYVGELLAFIRWCNSKRADWLTDFGRNRIESIQTRRNLETTRLFKKRVRKEFRLLLRHAEIHPIVHVDNITPQSFMEYILMLKHPRHGGYLSKSSYGNKRAALFHLFRVHNRIGFNDTFRLDLANLFRGFYRSIIQQQPQQPSGGGNGGGTGGDGGEGQGGQRKRVGKDPMSVDLYRAICGWFLDFGTSDGIFAHCFLIMSWNLACRSNNTALIKLSDISWASCFDALEIFFGHSKTDQVGEEAKYARHIFANLHSPLICPVLALSMYFSCCFNVPVALDGMLFPGRRQEDRFSDILGRVLEAHIDEVRLLGYERHDIGTHSIRKGAVSYLSSLPGGPPAAAICIRAGWTMGKVRDIYMRYVAAGDQFVGRCLALMPVLSMEFATSPPFFATVAGSGDADDAWVEGTRMAQYPMLTNIFGFGRLTRMCLASLLHHRGWIVSSLQVNHVVRTSSTALRSAVVLAKLDDSPQLLQVTFPWNDSTHTFSGIPPHVSLLQELTRLRQDQRLLIDGFVDRVKEALSQYGVNGDRLTEERLRQLLDDFQADLQVQLVRLEARANPAPGGSRVEQVEPGPSQYRLHLYGGAMHRVPADWRFPRCGVADLWRQWWIGDTVRQVPPLRYLEMADVKHLDNVPINEHEAHGRTGRFAGQRRPVKKTLCDMRFLMRWTAQKVEEAGAMESEITLGGVDRMFLAAAHHFSERERDVQKQWTTIVVAVRRRTSSQAAH